MKKFTKIIIMLACVLALVGCKKQGAGKQNPNQQSKGTEKSTFAVDVIKVIRGELNDYIKLSGNIQSKRNVKVFPDQSGKIANLYVKLGDSVRKGQKIMDVDPSKPGMTYANSPVFAPVSGAITALPFKIGETVSIQSAVATVGQLDSLELVANVAEKYISKMKVGLNVVVTVDAYRDLTFTGKTTEISPVVDETSRTLEVKADLTGPNVSLLKPGMYADIKVVTEYKANVFKIPSECIIERYGQTFVFVVTQIPTVITNKELDNLLKGATMEEQLLLLKYFPRVLPEQLRTDVFEYNILKSLEQRPEDQEILKSLYTFDKDKEMYITPNKKFGEKEQKAWNLFIELGRDYNIYTPDTVRKDKTQDLPLHELFISKNYIDANTLFVEKRVVKAGIKIDNKTEVTEGLKVDERVVYNGQSLLEDSARVKIVQELNVLLRNESLR